MLTTENVPTLIWNISNLERNLIFDFPMQCMFSGKKKSLGSSAGLDFICPGKLIWIWPKDFSPSTAVVFRIRNANPYFCCGRNHLMKCVCVREIVSNCVVSVFDHQCLVVTHIGVSCSCLWSRFSGSFLWKLNNLTQWTEQRTYQEHWVNPAHTALFELWAACKRGIS